MWSQILSLWLHEGSRVFEDRLTSDADHAWFKAQQAALIKARFGVEYGAVVTAPRLIYGDFMVPGMLRGNTHSTATLCSDAPAP